ncbi:hypothetical protein [Actinoplanes sp. NPDC051494]|uniref:hypothetical protein n=1 Tax=Actinoplanes sp. NPDC051494 TaxID=3363907 RepID=UPI00378CF959
MTIGSDNLSNGSPSAQDRFSGGVSAYRQNRRDAAMAVENGDGELVSRGGGPGLSSSGLPTRTPIEASGPLDRPTLDRSHLDRPALDRPALERSGKAPSLDMQGLTEPVFPSGGWIDATSTPTPIPAPSMADHPLLRGLLQELPARGTMPASDWLDRWFEAARSILELLYVQEAKHGK